MRAMLELPGFTLHKRIRSSSREEVLLGIRDADLQAIVATHYLADFERAHLILQRLRKLRSPYVTRALAAENSDEGSVLITEYFEGVALNAQILRSDSPAETFLTIATQLADGLGAIHEQNLLHKNLAPNNLRVSPHTLEAKITRLELAERLGVAEGAEAQVGAEVSLRYAAPEQTGRMGRGMDFRSDLYTLGASLYEFLVGRPPYREKHGLALIHAHIARCADPPHEVVPNVPLPLSRLVMTLLEKEPEDRYQTARALRHDLEICRECLARDGDLSGDVALEASHSGGRPLFSHRLYGRDREIETLRSAYAKVLAGRRQFLLIQGPAGIGKSALISELREPLIESGGYLARGKFDPYRSNRPYHGFAAAFQSLVGQILTETRENLERWRQQMSEQMGGLAPVVVDLVPDLRFILGDVPAISRLDPKGTQARLLVAALRLVQACATPEHPLVLFLDDLQWVDPGSRHLLEELLQHTEIEHLLIVATVRAEDEHGRNEAVDSLVSRLANWDPAPERIRLSSIGADAAARILADSLGIAADRMFPLAEAIVKRTGGIPFLIQQFVDHIYEKGLLRSSSAERWSWDLDEIAASDVPDDFVELITPKIRRLDDWASRALKLASCLGDEFDLETIIRLAGSDGARVEQGVYTLSSWGLIAPCSMGFRFVHDRVREAAQELLAETEKQELHLQIARLILKDLGREQRREQILKVADHLLRGFDQVPETERLDSVEIILEAVERALESGAPDTASGYVQSARRQVRSQDWREHRALEFRLGFLSAECAFQNQYFSEALEFLHALESRPLERMQWLQVAAKRIQVYALHRASIETTEYALAVLRRLGIRWPLHPSRPRVLWEMWKTEWLLRWRNPDTLFVAASEFHPDFEAQLIIGAASASMVQVDQHVTVLALCWSLTTFLRHGYSRSPGFTLAVYGAYRYLLRPDAGAAERWAQAALTWNERTPEPPFRGRTLLFVHAHIYLWIRPRRASVEPLLLASEVSREDGDPEWAYYSARFRAILRALLGDPVSEVIAELKSLRASEQMKPEEYPLALPLEQLQIRGEGLSLDQTLKRSHDLIRGGASRVPPQVHSLWMMVLCVHGRFELAFDESERIAETVMRISPFVHLPDYFFFRGLAAAATADGLPRRRVRPHRRVLLESLKQLRIWTRNNSDLAHMLSLLEAERAKLGGLTARALGAYQTAAEQAKSKKYLHHAAIAYERFAALAERSQRPIEAQRGLRSAVELYSRWGATAKAQRMRQASARIPGVRRHSVSAERPGSDV